MTEMVERVAKAIWCAEYPAEDWETGKHSSYFDAARAAIEAMRKPTTEMIETMKMECAMQFGVRSGAISIWEAGVNAALNTKKPPPQD